MHHKDFYDHFFHCDIVYYQNKPFRIVGLKQEITNEVTAVIRPENSSNSYYTDNDIEIEKNKMHLIKDHRETILDDFPQFSGEKPHRMYSGTEVDQWVAKYYDDLKQIDRRHDDNN